MLAIAALQLGAAAAVGADTDPLAVQSAAANAHLNGIADRFQVGTCASIACIFFLKPFLLSALWGRLGGRSPCSQSYLLCSDRMRQALRCNASGPVALDASGAAPAGSFDVCVANILQVGRALLVWRHTWAAWGSPANGSTPALQCTCQQDLEGTEQGSCAHLQGPLLELCPLLAGCVRPGGRILLSGILVTQWPALKGAYEQYFADFEVASEGDWALVAGTRSTAFA